ncbi:MAG: hypothetical protein M3040_10290, partial [Bacteroidota bacterium]|nr:hypothetical protein [Bacteroidota bacterium]
MKKTIVPICFICSAMLFFIQCKKDSATPAEINFSPLTAGSNWTYKYTEGTTTSTFTLTATNRDTVANTKTYRVLSS